MPALNILFLLVVAGYFLGVATHLLGVGSKGFDRVAGCCRRHAVSHPRVERSVSLISCCGGTDILYRQRGESGEACRCVR